MKITNLALVALVLSSVFLLCATPAAAQRGGEELWNFSTNQSIQSSPTVVDGTVYIGSGEGSGEGDGNLYALDAETGNKKWSFSADGRVDSSPIVTDNTVYFGSEGGNMYALNAQSGEEKWRIGRAGRPSGVTEDRVFFDSNGVYVVDKDSGEKVSSLYFSSSSSAVVDGTAYVLTGGHPDKVEGFLWTVDAKTVEMKWGYSMASIANSPPTVANGAVYFGRDNLHAVDTKSGERKWRFTGSGLISSSPTVIDERVYFGSNDGNLYALDTGSGDKIWNITLGETREVSHTLPGNGSTEEFNTTVSESVKSSPTVANKRVYVGSGSFSGDEGSLHAVNRETGEEVWEFSKPDGGIVSSPTVAGGVVYVGSLDGNLYAVDTGDANADSEGSRVLQGVLGHHDTYAEQGPTQPNTERENLSGFGFLVATIATTVVIGTKVLRKEK